MKSIIHTPNAVLITQAKPVGKIDKKIKEIIAQMKQTLEHASDPKGVGLAAPQVGLSLQIFIMWPDEEKPMRVCINPKIVSSSKKMVEGIPGDKDRIEGCLSIPEVWGRVKRHATVELEYLDEHGDTKKETFHEFEAIIAQHEYDHLQGILFPKRVVEQKGQLFRLGTDSKGKEILEPLEI